MDNIVVHFFISQTNSVGATCGRPPFVVVILSMVELLLARAPACRWNLNDFSIMPLRRGRRLDVPPITTKHVNLQM